MTNLALQIRIGRNDQGVWIYGPFNPANHPSYKLRGGKLDPTKPSRGEKPWRFARTAATEAMIGKLFGAPSPPVRVLLEATNITKRSTSWTVGGYLLAATRGRDKGVNMPVGVQLEEGNWLPSGGSMRHPTIEEEDVVLSVVVRREFAEGRQLKIVAEAPPSEPKIINPLAHLTDEVLLVECRRRGLVASA